MSRKKLIISIAFIVASIVGTALFFSWSSAFFAVDYGKDKKITLEIFAAPKYNVVANFTLEIPRLNTSAEVIQARYYDITKRPDPGLAQIVGIDFHLPGNKSGSCHFIVTELEPIKGWASEHYIYNDIVQNSTTSWMIREYFSSFIAVYSVKTPWLNGLSEMTTFRDAYHYEEGISGNVNHYSTDRIPLLISTLSVSLSLTLFGLTLVAFPYTRSRILRYYPWLTLLVVCTSVLTFLFWTPAEFYVSSLGSLSFFLSYFLHFDSTHLLGNLQMGIILLFLLETWFGAGLSRSSRMRLQALTFIFAGNSLFWAIGMRGFGASYVNEVLGTLLMAQLIYFREDLTRTRIRSVIYVVACFLAGYALLSYVINWFVQGYVFNTSLEDANLHIAAFAVGLILVLASFLAQEKPRGHVLHAFRDLRSTLAHL